MNKIDNINFNDPRIRIQRKSISDFEIESRRTDAGGFSRETLAEWGIPWPPAHGWRKAILRYGVPLLPIDTSSKTKMKKSSRQAWHLMAQIENGTPYPQPAPQPQPIDIPYRKPRFDGPPSGFTPTEEMRKSFYISWEWRTIRMEVLKEQGSVCSCCGARPGDRDTGGNPVRIVVDHIKSIFRHWHLRLDKKNLQVLCDECNQGKGAWDETDHRKVV